MLTLIDLSPTSVLWVGTVALIFFLAAWAKLLRLFALGDVLVLATGESAFVGDLTGDRLFDEMRTGSLFLIIYLTGEEPAWRAGDRAALAFLGEYGLMPLAGSASTLDTFSSSFRAVPTLIDLPLCSESSIFCSVLSGDLLFSIT